MSIKTFVYSAQQQLRVRTDSDLKRAHVYELLAASFGFKSYSALCTEGVLVQSEAVDPASTACISSATGRGMEIGYTKSSAGILAAGLRDLITQHRLTFIGFSNLIDELHGQPTHETMVMDFPDGHAPPLLIEQLEAAAGRNVALAHYALSLLYSPDEGDESEPRRDYWYRQAQQGQILSPAQQQFSDEYAAYLTQLEKFRHHLGEAARLGCAWALLDQADYFDDPSFFDNASELPEGDAIWISDIAERLNRPADAKRWLTAAAETGNVDAMCQLIHGYDQHDLARCWTWLHLARLMGTDLTQDHYYAIHEDGSEYDDDIGGPAEVAGEDGIDLPALSDEADMTALNIAKDMHSRIMDQAKSEA